MNLKSKALIISFCTLVSLSSRGAPAALQNLILQLEGCGGMLSRTDEHQQIKVPTTLLTEPRLIEFKKRYSQLETSSETTDTLRVSISKLSETDSVQFLADLLFLKLNPETPIENQSSSLDNYSPKNDSQIDLLKWSRKLIDYKGGKGSGLFIHGTPGLGKTHISVAVAKEFLKTGAHPLFISAGTTRITEAELSGHDVFIIDDLNGAYDQKADSFLKVITYVHDHGGKIFVTSNSNFEKLFEGLAGPHSSRKEDGPRYRDRIKNMLKFIEVSGDSNRTDEAWFN